MAHKIAVLSPGLGDEGEDGYILRTPYDQAFVDQLKALVPWDLRSWDNESKTWWVHEDYLDSVEELCSEHFDRVELA